MSAQSIAYASPICPPEEAHHQGIYNDRAKYFKRYMEELHDVKVSVFHVAVEDVERVKDSGLPVIQTSVSLPKALAGFQRSLTCEKPGIYEELDDKSKMINFDFPAQFPQIPTVSMKDAKIEDLKTLMGGAGRQIYLKPNDGAASEDQKAVAAEELHEYIGHDLVAQPYFAEHETIEFNFLAIEGKLIDWTVCSTPGGVENDMYYRGMEKKNLREEPIAKKMAAFAAEMIGTHNISGLMEIEFLKAGDQYFLLEVNPRISASLCIFDLHGISEYMERLVVPYFTHFGIELKSIPTKSSDTLFLPPFPRVEAEWQKRFRTADDKAAAGNKRAGPQESERESKKLKTDPPAIAE